MSFQNVSVIGLGYIGLPTAAMFASRKVKVTGIDLNQATVDTINKGQIHIIEPDLESLVRMAVIDGYLKATTKPVTADAYLIAVPTPFNKSSKGEVHTPDITFIQNAAKAIAPVLKKGDLVILESTSPIGTTEKLAEWLRDARPDLVIPNYNYQGSVDVNIAYCPERVLPGRIVKELVENDRIIGGMTNSCSDRAVLLYKMFVEGDCLITNTRTAEMAKLTENSYRDVNIAFANELSMICEENDINVWELITLANQHPRVNILNPGPGVGGHCIAVDPWFIVSKNPGLSQLIHTARNVNDGKVDWVLKKIEKVIDAYLQVHHERTAEEITVSCFGLSFKPDIDDLRESPALNIAVKLATQSPYRVIAVEPNITHEIDKLGRPVSIAYALENSDVSVILVRHKEFEDLTFDGILVIDTVGLLPHKFNE